MNPHIKKREIITAREEVNLEAAELFSINNYYYSDGLKINPSESYLYKSYCIIV